jgi:hypothetical protein
VKHCTYHDCHRSATSAVKGEGRLYWYRCPEHKGLRANGERGEILTEDVGL